MGVERGERIYCCRGSARAKTIAHHTAVRTERGTAKQWVPDGNVKVTEEAAPERHGKRTNLA